MIYVSQEWRDRQEATALLVRAAEASLNPERLADAIGFTAIAAVKLANLDAGNRALDKLISDLAEVRDHASKLKDSKPGPAATPRR